MLAWCEPGVGAAGQNCRADLPAVRDESASLGTQASHRLKPKKKMKTAPPPPPPNQNTHRVAALWPLPGTGHEEMGEMLGCSPSPCNDAHALGSVAPADAHTFSRPMEGTRVLPALWGHSGQQTSREIGCVKSASDQIQPTASGPSSRSLWIPRLGDACWSPAPLRPCLALPRCLSLQGCSWR